MHNFNLFIPCCCQFSIPTSPQLGDNLILMLPLHSIPTNAADTTAKHTTAADEDTTASKSSNPTLSTSTSSYVHTYSTTTARWRPTNIVKGSRSVYQMYSQLLL